MELETEFEQGLKNVFWPGRTQKVNARNVTWMLDGAHTKESIQVNIDG